MKTIFTEIANHIKRQDYFYKMPMDNEFEIVENINKKLKEATTVEEKLNFIKQKSKIEDR